MRVEVVVESTLFFLFFGLPARSARLHLHLGLMLDPCNRAAAGAAPFLSPCVLSLPAGSSRPGGIYACTPMWPNCYTALHPKHWKSALCPNTWAAFICSKLRGYSNSLRQVNRPRLAIDTLDTSYNPDQMDRPLGFWHESGQPLSGAVLDVEFDRVEASSR